LNFKLAKGAKMTFQEVTSKKTVRFRYWMRIKSRVHYPQLMYQFSFVSKKMPFDYRYKPHLVNAGSSKYYDFIAIVYWLQIDGVTSEQVRAAGGNRFTCTHARKPHNGINN